MTALLIGSSINSFAGAGMADGKTMPEKKPDANPLSFLDGKLVFDFQERLRWEIRDNNFDFNSDVNALTDDSWFLHRVRLGLMIKPTDWLKIYAQGQDSREINSDRPDFPGLLGAEGDDSFDLRQGYVAIGNPKQFPLTLKVGRQILSYGDERVLGAFDWNNIGRTFDAVKLCWEQKGWSLDAFAASVVVPERGSYNQSDLFNGNETKREQVFSGLYFSTTAIPVQATDVYVLHLHENTNARYLPTAKGNTDFVTIGLRGKSKPGAFASQPAMESDGKSMADGTSTPKAMLAPKAVGLDYTYEFAFQTGNVRGLDLTAFAAHGDVGYTLDMHGVLASPSATAMPLAIPTRKTGTSKPSRTCFQRTTSSMGRRTFSRGRISTTLSWISKFRRSRRSLCARTIMPSFKPRTRTRGTVQTASRQCAR